MDQQSKRGARITVEQQVELITSDGHLLPVTLGTFQRMASRSNIAEPIFWSAKS